MQDTGSGGIGAVSIGIADTLIWVVVLVVAILVIWKVAKLLLAALD